MIQLYDSSMEKTMRSSTAKRPNIAVERKPKQTKTKNPRMRVSK
jgi:hypothetical protein